MYNTFFGFREKPFKLVPNPAYLFLSRSHEIALAHLSYALEHGEGFAVITGEVGTGKTTLCRKFLEGLDDTVASAYIFNPRLESPQLLSAICHEFGIDTRESGLKALLDLLNAYLIKKNAERCKVVLLIDEAQGLSIDSLELVRMLSNLETTRSKLLQIVLMGQPELEEKLESVELRQLAQRISLSYRLAPLTAKDTQAYIQHRMWIAAQRQLDLFSANAYRQVYRFSRGIPRLINIVCDRALLIAYSQNRPKVDNKVMQTAIMEILNSWKTKKAPRRWPWLAGGGVCLLALIIAAAFFIARSHSNPSLTRDAGGSQAPEDPAPVAKVEKTFKISDSDAAGQEVGAVPAEIQQPPVSDERIEAVEIPEKPTPPSRQPSEQPLPPAMETSSQDAKAAPPENSPAPNPLPPSRIEKGAPERIGPSDIADLIGRLGRGTSRKLAVYSLLSIWRQPRPNAELIPPEAEDGLFFDIAARQYGLRCFASLDNNWDLVRHLNLPAIITLKKDKSDEPVYLTLAGWQDKTLYLEDGKNTGGFETDFDTIRPYLQGSAYIYWNNALGFDMIISYGADPRAVLILKNLLRNIGYDQISKSPDFDLGTRAAVLDFQARNKLTVDGLVGTLTKIKLLQEARTITVPTLRDANRPQS
jgi:general secretion pathway protein A